MDDTFSVTQIRKFILANQSLRIKNQIISPLELLKKIHNIQIDTISVVARSHDLTLFNRLSNYREKDIWKLEKEGKIFEYFSHSLCFLPIEEYPFYMWIIDYMSKNPGEWTKNWIKDNQRVIDRVYNEVKKAGPICSSDFKNTTKVKREGWWEIKAENIALKYLFHTGKLLVSHRKGFQRYYDLPERVIPPNIDSEHMVKEEIPFHMLNVILNALGVVSVAEIQNYIGNIFPKLIWDNKKELINEFLVESENKGIITRIEIKDLENEYYLIENEYNDFKKTLNDNDDKLPVKLLSPFDNIIRDRYYPKKMWNFDYTFEAYLPKTKRQFGFYLLPILDNCELIGNIDVKVFRKEKKLDLISIYIEKDLDDNLLTRLVEGIINFAKFNNCDKIALSQIYPQNIKKMLIPEIEGLMEIQR